MFVVPRRTLVFNKIFEDAGILGDLVVEELPWYFLPLENDVLSLELNDSFGDLFLVGTSLAIFASCVLTLGSAKILQVSTLRLKH